MAEAAGDRPINLWYKTIENGGAQLYWDQGLRIPYNDISDESMKLLRPEHTGYTDGHQLMLSDLARCLNHDRELFDETYRRLDPVITQSYKELPGKLQGQVTPFNRSLAYGTDSKYFGALSFTGVQSIPERNFVQRLFTSDDGIRVEAGTGNELIGHFYNTDQMSIRPVFARGAHVNHRAVNQRRPKPITRQGPPDVYVTTRRSPPSIFRNWTMLAELHIEVSIEDECCLLVLDPGYVVCLYVAQGGRDQVNVHYRFRKTNTFGTRTIHMIIIVGGDNAGRFVEDLGKAEDPIRRGARWEPIGNITVTYGTDNKDFTASLANGLALAQHLFYRSRKLGGLDQQSQFEEGPIHYCDDGKGSVKDNPQFFKSRLWELKFPFYRFHHNSARDLNGLIVGCIGERVCHSMKQPANGSLSKSEAEGWTWPITAENEARSKSADIVNHCANYYETIETVCYSIAFPPMMFTWHRFLPLFAQFAENHKYDSKCTNGIQANGAFDLNTKRMHYIMMLEQDADHWFSHELYPNVKLLEASKDDVINFLSNKNNTKEIEVRRNNEINKFLPRDSETKPTNFVNRFETVSIKPSGGWINNFWRKLWLTRMERQFQPDPFVNSLFEGDDGEAQRRLFERWEPFFYHDMLTSDYYLSRPLEYFYSRPRTIRTVYARLLLSKAKNGEFQGIKLPNTTNKREGCWLSGMSAKYFEATNDTPPQVRENAMLVQFTLEPNSDCECVLFDFEDMSDIDLQVFNHTLEGEKIHPRSVTNGYINNVQACVQQQERQTKYHAWPARLRGVDEVLGAAKPVRKPFHEYNRFTIYFIGTADLPPHVVYGAVNVPTNVRVHIVNSVELSRHLQAGMLSQRNINDYLEPRNPTQQDLLQANIVGEVWRRHANGDSMVVGVLKPEKHIAAPKLIIDRTSWRRRDDTTNSAYMFVFRSYFHVYPELVKGSKIRRDDRIYVIKEARTQSILHFIHIASNSLFDVAKGYPCVGNYPQVYNCTVDGTREEPDLTFKTASTEPVAQVTLPEHKKATNPNRQPVAGSSSSLNPNAGVFTPGGYQRCDGYSPLVEMVMSVVGAGMALAVAQWSSQF